MQYLEGLLGRGREGPSGGTGLLPHPTPTFLFLLPAPPCGSSWFSTWPQTGLKTGAELAPGAFPLGKVLERQEPKYRGSGKTGEDGGKERGQGARKLSSTSQLSHHSAAAGAEGDGSRGALLRNDSSFMRGGVQAERQQQPVRLRPAGQADPPWSCGSHLSLG